jgi:hypothetical protein
MDNIKNPDFGVLGQKVVPVGAGERFIWTLIT